MSTLLTDQIGDSNGSKIIPINSVTNGTINAWTYDHTAAAAADDYNISSYIDGGDTDTTNFTNAFVSGQVCNTACASRVSNNRLATTQMTSTTTCDSRTWTADSAGSSGVNRNIVWLGELA